MIAACGWLWWTDNATDTIRRVDAQGEVAEAVVSVKADGGAGPAGIAAGAGYLWWGDFLGHTISRMPLSGGPVEVVARDQRGAFGVAVDARRGLVFWNAQDGGEVRGMEVAGGEPSAVVSGAGLGSGRGLVDLAIDAGAGWLYWTDVGTRRVQRARVGGSEAQTLVTEPEGGQPYGLVVDTQGEALYWTDFTRGRVRTSGLDGANARDLMGPDPGHYVHLAIDVPGRTLFVEHSDAEGRHEIRAYLLAAAAPSDPTSGDPSAPEGTAGAGLPDAAPRSSAVAGASALATGKSRVVVADAGEPGDLVWAACD